MHIDDQYLMKPLENDDPYMKKSKEFLEKNQYNVDFKRVKQAFEGSLWRDQIKESLSMQKVVSQRLNRNNIEQRSTIRLFGGFKGIGGGGMGKKSRDVKNIKMIN